MECNDCGENFERLSNSQKRCSKCKKLHVKKYLKNYMVENKENIKNNVKKYQISEKGIISSKKAKKKFCESRNMTEYRKLHPTKKKSRSEYEKIKKKTDINFKLSVLLRKRIYSVMNGKGIRKATKSIELLGCEIKEYKEHLEKQFKNGWNWLNHGVVWEIDHIIPICSFDLTNVDEQKKAFNYKNTQPLSIFENRQKGGRKNRSTRNL